MSTPDIRTYHPPTVQALGSVRDLTRGGDGSGADGGVVGMRMGASDARLKDDIRPLLG